MQKGIEKVARFIEQIYNAQLQAHNIVMKQNDKYIKHHDKNQIPLHNLVWDKVGFMLRRKYPKGNIVNYSHCDMTYTLAQRGVMKIFQDWFDNKYLSTSYF